MTPWIEDQPLESMACLAGSVAGEGLKEVTIVPWGETRSSKGSFVVDAESARMIIEAFEAHQVDLVVDWEHQSLGGAAYSAPDGRAPAAGWIERLWADPGRGIRALVAWNDEARNSIRERTYQYLSPVLQIRLSDRRVAALRSVALTNVPAIPGMERLAASERPFTETLSMAEDEQAKQQEGDGGDGESAADLIKAIADKLRSVGALESGAKSVEDVLRAVLEKLEGGETTDTDADSQVASSVRNRLGLADDASRDEVILALSMLAGTGQGTVMSDKSERNAQAMVDMYLKSGRINPRDEPAIAAAMSMARTNPERLRALMDNAASVLPPQGKTEGPPVASLRGKAIRSAIATYQDDEALQAQTSMEAYTNLTLHDESLPRLREDELATFV